jgi:pimeloyl-ACP methyl ester carboxylesterase
MSVTACGVDVFVRDTGSGEPVLFLHGNPDSADLWDGVIDHLKDRYRCIAIDLPGFARSKAPADFDYSLENLARFVDATVEAIGIREPLNLVAHDFGGSFAMSWAIAHPAKVRRIVVINHSSFVEGFKWHWRARVWRTPLLGELSMLATRWPLFRASMQAGSRKLTEDQIRSAYERLSPQWRRMVLRLYRASGPAERAKWVARTQALTARIPTLVLWGEHDPFIPSSTADKFNAKKVVRFPESGHFAPAEVPDRVASEIRSFFAG